MAARHIVLLLCLPLVTGCFIDPAIDTEDVREASALGDVDQAAALLDRGDSPNTHDCDGNTPLHLAVANDQPAAAAFLVDRGANVNAVNDAGQTPLHLAASFDDPLLVHLLLTHGADVAARDNDGNTPLHVAAMSDETYNAELLLNAGASPTARNNANQTPQGLTTSNEPAATDLLRRGEVREVKE